MRVCALDAVPTVFYPTWDPMQANTFRQRCASAAPTRTHALGELRAAVCTRLRRERFRPTVTSDAVTNHLWTHTWIPGAQKVSMRDVVELQ